MEDNVPFFFWIRMWKTIMSKTTSRMMRAKTFKVLMAQANRIGILWPLSSASLLPLALPHTARIAT